MSFGDFRSHAAIVGLVIAVISASIFFGSWTTVRPVAGNFDGQLEHKKYDPLNSAEAFAAVRNSLGKQAYNSREYQPNCDAPKDHEEADECAQRHMADVADEMATFTRVQTGIGIASAVGLIATLLLTLAALKQARRSADAAHDSNRPWIEVVITEKRAFSIKPQLARAAFMASLKNRGNSPATSVKAQAILVAVREGQHEPLAAINRLEEFLVKRDFERPSEGSTIFPGVELDPQPYGANLFREALDQAAGGHGNKVRFWVAIGVTYRFGDRKCRTLYGYLLKSPGRPEALATSETVELKPDEFTLAGMGQEYST